MSSETWWAIAILAILFPTGIMFATGTGLEPILDWLSRKMGLQAETGKAQPGATGVEGLLASTGTVSTEVDPESSKFKVTVAGSLWDALSESQEESIAIGDRVRVVSVSGLELVVKKLDNDDKE